jgi:hypothetical protein
LFRWKLAGNKGCQLNWAIEDNLKYKIIRSIANFYLLNNQINKTSIEIMASNCCEFHSEPTLERQDDQIRKSYFTKLNGVFKSRCFTIQTSGTAHPRNIQFSQEFQKTTKNLNPLSKRHLGFPGQKILQGQRTQNSAVSVFPWNSNFGHNRTINSFNKTAHITANYGFSKIKIPQNHLPYQK